jgi:hypothetical protein
MFEFFKRWTSPAPAPKPQRSRVGESKPKSRKASTDPRLAAPGPLPEVVEGNDETDWALWEDSVISQRAALDSQRAGLDSQRQGLSSQASGLDKLNSSQFDEVDAFANVRKRDR